MAQSLGLREIERAFLRVISLLLGAGACLGQAPPSQVPVVPPQVTLAGLTGEVHNTQELPMARADVNAVNLASNNAAHTLTDAAPRYKSGWQAAVCVGRERDVPGCFLRVTRGIL